MRHIALRCIGASVALLISASPAFAGGTGKSAALKAAVPITAHAGMAPADEYFGRFHMSVLGIRNALHDFGAKAATDPAHASSILSGVALLEDAVRDWSMRYPQDPMLPKTLLGLERLYLHIGGSDAADHAQDTVTWFDTILPNDPYTRMAHTLVQNPATAVTAVAVAPVSDDGSPVTNGTPEALGVVPGLMPSVLPPLASDASASPAASAPVASLPASEPVAKFP